MVHAHNFSWRRVLEEAFNEFKMHWPLTTRKCKFFQNFGFFCVNLVTYSCKVVGQAFGHLKLVLQFKEESCHPEFSVFTVEIDWWATFEDGFDEWVMRRSRVANEKWYLLVASHFGDDFVFFRRVTEHYLDDYLILVVNVEEEEFHIINKTLFVETRSINV